MGDYVDNHCYECRHKRDVPGNAHIQCVKPDPTMQGNKHGRKMGWFFYPFLFDPVWMESKCHNYEKKGEPISP